MPDTILAASRLAAQGGAFEPQRKNNWLLILEPPGAGQQDSQVIMWSLRSFPFPREKTGAVVIPYLNSERKVPGKTTYDTCQLELNDYVDQRTAKIMLDWKRKVFNPKSGATGLAKDVKKQATLIQFAPDGTSKRTWKLIGVWPGDIDFGEGSMEDEKQNTIKVQLNIDYWEEINAVGSGR